MVLQNVDRKQDDLGPLTKCPECGCSILETVYQTETFDHGGRKKPIRVTASLPLKRCRNCQFTFEDALTEKVRHAAACKQVGVQSPSEIISIRKMYSLSQRTFARETRLGVATLNRWERGSLIQNDAYDDYLYLLRFPENLARLRQRRREEGPAPLRKFRCLQPSRELDTQARHFRITSASRRVALAKPEQTSDVTAELSVN